MPRDFGPTTEARLMYSFDQNFVCVVQEFLLMEECRSNILADEESIVNKGSAVVQLKNVTAFWDKVRMCVLSTATITALRALPSPLKKVFDLILTSF